MFAVSSIIVSVSTIATIMVYTLTGHDLNPVTVSELFFYLETIEYLEIFLTPTRLPIETSNIS